MWQHHYVIHDMRMKQLRLEADRERRWRLEADRERRWRLEADRERRFAAPHPGAARAWAARAVAWFSRAAARVARRLDERAAVDLGAERLVRDA